MVRVLAASAPVLIDSNEKEETSPERVALALVARTAAPDPAAQGSTRKPAEASTSASCSAATSCSDGYRTSRSILKESPIVTWGTIEGATGPKIVICPTGTGLAPPTDGVQQTSSEEAGTLIPNPEIGIRDEVAVADNGPIVAGFPAGARDATGEEHVAPVRTLAVPTWPPKKPATCSEQAFPVRHEKELLLLPGPIICSVPTLTTWSVPPRLQQIEKEEPEIPLGPVAVPNECFPAT
jgi:hypothetical protein